MEGNQGTIHPDYDTKECPTGTSLCRDPDGDATITGKIDNYICVINHALSQNELLKNCPITSIGIDYIPNPKHD